MRDCNANEVIKKSHVFYLRLLERLERLSPN